MDEHRTGRFGQHGCPTRKWAYESEQHARRALRQLKEHGVMRTGRPYSCKAGATPLHWHLTSQPKIRKKEKR